MKQFRVFFLGILILILGGCSSSSRLDPLALLTGNTWVLSTLKGGEVDLTKFRAGVPTLNFLDGGRLAGFAGCNNFSGGFSLEGEGINLDPGAMTRMACQGTGEDEFISALGRVKNFAVEKKKLILLDGNTELMSFVPKKD